MYNEFFNNLANVNAKYIFLPERIFNINETGCTIKQKTKQVLALQRQNRLVVSQQLREGNSQP